jgi:hypothetical protein
MRENTEECILDTQIGKCGRRRQKRYKDCNPGSETGIMCSYEIQDLGIHKNEKTPT